MRRCRQYVAAAESVFEPLYIGNFRNQLIDGGVSIVPSPAQDGTAALVPATTSPVKVKEFWSTEFTAPKPAIEKPVHPAAVTGQQCTSQSSQRITGSKLIRMYVNEITDLRGRDISKGIEKKSSLLP